MIGIYKITNKINNKCYIGQSIHIEKRFKEHIKSNFDTPLCKAFKKYGVDNFIFEVVEECVAEQLNDKEIYYIQHFKSSTEEWGYNLTFGGNNNIGGFSKQTREKISKSRIGEKNPMYGKPLSKESLAKRSITYKKTLQNMSEEKKKQWSESNRKGHLGIRNTEEQKKKISNSLKEFYKNHPEKRQEISKKGKGIKRSEKFCEQLKIRMKKEMQSYCKRVMQYDLQGNYITFYDSLSEAEEKTGIIRTSISKCCIGKMYTAGGFKWKYDEEFNNKYRKPAFRPTTPKKPLKGYAKEQPKQWKKVYQYDKEWNFIKEFPSLTHAAKEYGIKSVISKVCLGKRPTAYGFRWSYILINDKNDIINYKNKEKQI